MSRIHKRQLGSRRYRDYSFGTLQKAITDILIGKLSYSAAAEAYNIPRRTLVNKIKQKHLGKIGSPTALPEATEKALVDVLVAAADFGCPLTMDDLKTVVKSYLDGGGQTVYKFKNNTPGKDWCLGFIKRHRHVLTNRQCQNIKRARAEKSEDDILEYFTRLEQSLVNIPPSRILNYDEPNFTDEPGSKKCIFRRGCKYPERVMNSTKSSISIMFAVTADGQSLPPYIVYKAERLYDAWCIGGPRNAGYNRTKSGWFDSYCFEDWFKNIVVPWAKSVDGPKFNLCSHLNLNVLQECQKYNIRFTFVPPNSTHLTQPLDISFFKRLKNSWRKIITEYKTKNPRDSVVNKSTFPTLLKCLLEEIEINKSKNIKSGFRAAGICPFNKDEVLKRLPNQKYEQASNRINDTLLAYLKDLRSPSMTMQKRKKKTSSGTRPIPLLRRYNKIRANNRS